MFRPGSDADGLNIPLVARSFILFIEGAATYKIRDNYGDWMLDKMGGVITDTE